MRVGAKRVRLFWWYMRAVEFPFLSTGNMLFTTIICYFLARFQLQTAIFLNAVGPNLTLNGISHIYIYKAI